MSCRGSSFTSGENCFCCQGCLTVFELLTENGLGDYYRFGGTAGVRVKALPLAGQFDFLDAPAVRERLVDFTNGQVTRVTFHLPAIHCIACVWLLENLFRLKPGVGQSQVHFPRKEVAVTFENAKIKLSELAALLASLGYEPELKFSDLQATRHRQTPRRLWLQLGVAGFAFGNVMLFSLSSYLGLDSLNGPAFRKLMGWFSFVLATPVFFYSAADYWRAAWVSLRQRLLTIDVPIAAGIAALYGQSLFEVVTGRGEGYFDSLAGLLFFLLCGKLFQQKTYDRLAFDRDYRSFFPLSVTRKLERRLPARRDELAGLQAVLEAGDPGEERVSLSQLAVGDRLVLRNGELIPADARLVDGPALIDYSFVTGESEPVEKKPGDYLYAGGRQIGGAIEAETTKAVSQGYLTSLWNQEAFRKDKTDTLDTLINRYSQRFTKLVFAIALGSAAYWAFADSARAVKAFASVLIVACPCALALAAPFALGTAVRLLGRRKVFLKNAQVVETLARVDAVVFDKTGTLTAAGAGSVTWHGAGLEEAEERWLYSMTRHSTHPLAVRIGEAIAREHFPEPVRSFLETAGGGMEGGVAGNEIWMGSAAWLESRGACPVGFGPPSPQPSLHEALPGARTALSARSQLNGLADKAVRAPADGRFMAPMRDLEPVEALHEPGRRRREEPHSLSTEEDQKLLTSSPTVHGLNARPKLEVEAFHEATDREPSRLAARGVSDAAVNIRACEPIRAAATGDRSRSGNRAHRPDARPNLEVEAAREPERRAPTRLVEAQSIRAASECGAPASSGSTVHVAINGRYRGCFQLAGALRPETDRLIRRLSRDYELALLSGDHATERERFAGLFGATARLHFNQSPLDKLGFIRQLQERGRTVMMVGDGLNDAGALQQSDVGVAVVENVGAFSPASDVIASSGTVPQLAGVLRFARDAVRVVRAAFVVSAAYNVIGVAIAASGRLSPVVCAVLMPLSSITVVAFACGATAWAARRGAQGKTFAKDVEPKPSRLNHEEEAPA